MHWLMTESMGIKTSELDHLVGVDGEGGGGSPCCMSIIRNDNAALSIFRKSCVTLPNLKKPCVACCSGLKRAVSPCRF